MLAHLNEFLGTDFNMLSIGNEVYSSGCHCKNPKYYLLGHVEVHWLSGRMYCLHLQGESISWSIKQASSKQQSYFYIFIHLVTLVNSGTVHSISEASHTIQNGTIIIVLGYRFTEIYCMYVGYVIKTSRPLEVNMLNI
jgi:hypothetical protein